MNRKPVDQHRFTTCFTFFSVITFSLILLAGCTKKKQAAAPPPPVVEVVQVAAKDTPVSFEYVAQTQSSRQVSIQARVNGFLDSRVYTEGSIVKAGDVLFRMDSKPFQAQANGAAAALARQKAAMETARQNLERTRPLVARNALSQRDLDEASGNFESSAAAVEQAKSQLETAQLNLSYCTITSPLTGISSAALQQNGTYINQQNSQLTTVAALSPIWVNFSLSENEMQKYREQIAKKRLIPPRNGNYAVDILMVDGSLFPYKGRITFAAPSYNAQTGTFFLRASVDNPEGLLRPNQYVRVRLNGAVRPGAILVPQRAVQQGAKGHYVWVVNRAGMAEHRPVTADEWHGSNWFISEGLRSGEQVVVDGGLSLQPGITVTTRRPVPAPHATNSSGASGTAVKQVN